MYRGTNDHLNVGISSARTGIHTNTQTHTHTPHWNTEVNAFDMLTVVTVVLPQLSRLGIAIINTIITMAYN